ncbi:MAG: zinc ribbon domain-containing protein [Ilumatobacteraceae bacterium]
MPLWDFFCATCNRTSELFFPSYAASENAVCPHCHAPVVRQPAAGSFVVNGYNAKNHYSKK